jgi:retron-type reverse transcriptase
VFERFLIVDSFACRIGKGREAAVARASEMTRRYRWFLKLDIRKYFNSIRHDTLISLLARKFKDRRLLDVFGRIIAVRLGSVRLGSDLVSSFFDGWHW